MARASNAVERSALARQAALRLPMDANEAATMQSHAKAGGEASS